ncbi:MAG: N-6 DNA methylase [Burkholderiales bacterium]|jgi:adenine-specific DNA-methyltransferase|nr:N-6 DNA methylase [Burkholderiales bacterium]
MTQSTKNKYGQYFTHPAMAAFMVNLLGLEKTAKVLEPACGPGVFLEALQQAGYKNICGMDIDPAFAHLENVNCGDYLQDKTLQGACDGIVGNPPYIRWKNLPEPLKSNLKTSEVWNTHCNSLCDYSTPFIAKAVNDLKPDGVLVFITPEYWLYTYHTQKLRDHLLANGSVTQLFHFDEANLFDGAKASFIVFRFKKNSVCDTAVWKLKNKKNFDFSMLATISETTGSDAFEHFSTPRFKPGTRWGLEPVETAGTLNALEQVCTPKHKTTHSRLGDVCDIANGMVSGLDAAFQIKNLTYTENEAEHVLPIAKARHLSGITLTEITPYLFFKNPIAYTQSDFSALFPQFAAHLQAYKPALDKRYNYGRQLQAWEWAFPRNYALLSKAVPKIFVPCKERLNKNTNHRFTWIPAGVYPTQDVSALIKKQGVAESLGYLHAFLRQALVTLWIRNRGIARGGVSEFSEGALASIPVRLIDWENPEECEIHASIEQAHAKAIAGDTSAWASIEFLFNKLLMPPQGSLRD